MDLVEVSVVDSRPVTDKMVYKEQKPREQIYDETIKNLEIKDCKALAGLAVPNIDEADDILLVARHESRVGMRER